MSGCASLIHVANPIFTSAANMTAEQQVATAVDGVVTVFSEAVDCGVKRVVVTATMASICGNQRKSDPNHLWVESDWNDDMASAYSRGKTMAEKKLWELAAQHPTIEVTTIHPSMVIGPLLPDQKPRSTAGMLLKFCDGSNANGVPLNMFGICDVRDVAEAHVKALTAREAVGQRYMVNSVATYTTLELCALIGKLFPSIAVPTKYDDPKHDGTVGRALSTDQTKIKAFLGRSLVEPTLSITDTINSYQEHGYLPKK